MKKLLLALLFAPMLAFAAMTLDLNSAPKDQIEKLPGVGPAIAKDIIAKRPFKSVDELKDIKGIGEAKFAKLKDLVVVEPKDAAKTVMPQGLKPGETINVNTASSEDLQRLPGIGPEKAKAIIAGRPYATAEDLNKVRGIKGGTLAKIKAFVTTK